MSLRSEIVVLSRFFRGITTISLRGSPDGAANLHHYDQPAARRASGRGLGEVSPLHYCVAMTKWEYATVPVLIHATKQILDTWGEDGWELVQMMPGPNPQNLVAYFKRPLDK